MPKSNSPLTELVAVRVTPALKAAIQAKAERFGLNEPDLVRFELAYSVFEWPQTLMFSEPANELAADKETQ